MMWIVVPLGAMCQEPPPCTTELAQGQEAYQQENYDAALRLAAACLNKDDVRPQAAVRAYRLQAMSFIKQGQLEEAKEAVIQLLTLAPNYTPDPVQDPPAYAAVVSVVRQQITPPPAPPEATPPPVTPQEPQRSWLASPKTWVIVGGGLLAAGLTFALIQNGDAGGEVASLPAPPAFP